VWGSPALYHNNIFVGVSSFGDCPLVQGQIFQLDASTGNVLHVLATVPAGCVGGGVWGTPAIDTVGGWVYFTTGNPGSCNQAEPNTDAILKAYAVDITATVDRWQVHTGDRADLDMASAPTLYAAAIGGVSHPFLGVGGKDGNYYVLDRNHMSRGPLWRVTIAISGACPQCGQGVIAPSAYDGGSLYVAGGAVTLSGVACRGSLSALNPATGAFRWRHCMGSGPVLGAVSLAGTPGVAFVGEGTSVVGISTASGATVYRFNTGTAGATFWGSSSIAASMLFSGNQNGTLYAFGF
jgi:hypothetical protein